MLQKLGKFEVVRSLGRGAMGEVLLGRDPVIGREIALKTILASSNLGEEAQSRFAREAMAAGQLNHPNVVTVYEFGEDQGVYYLAMEYVPGEEFQKHILDCSLTLPEMIEVLAQICEGVGHAHSKGIIHRDLKPANVMVARQNRKLVAKVMDFGIAKTANSEMTGSGTIMGTVSYMAPEYIETGKATVGTDVFALGVMTYEALTYGRKPFPGQTPTEVLRRILLQDPIPLEGDELEGLGPTILPIINKALLKDPKQRYQSADSLGRALRLLQKRPTPKLAMTRTEVVQTRPEPPLALPEPILPLPLPPPTPLVLPATAEDSGSTRMAVPRTILVNKQGRGDFSNLGEALLHATEGTRVILTPGHYVEQVILGKNQVELFGHGTAAEIILENAEGPTLVLQGEGLKVAHLTIRQSGDHGDGAVEIKNGTASLEDLHVESHSGPGIRLGCSSSLRIQDSTMSQCGHVGLSVEPGAVADLSGCRFMDLKAGGVEVWEDALLRMESTHIKGCDPGGVLLFERGRAELHKCALSVNSAAAVHVTSEAHALLRDCNLQLGEGFGITLMEGGTATLEGCEIGNNRQAGVCVGPGGRAQLKECRINDGRSFGAIVKGQCVLEGCELVNNAKTALQVEEGGHLQLLRCTIRDGRDGGLKVLAEAQASLEACVIERNANFGILLAPGAPEPVLRAVRMTDNLVRERGDESSKA